MYSFTILIYILIIAYSELRTLGCKNFAKMFTFKMSIRGISETRLGVPKHSSGESASIFLGKLYGLLLYTLFKYEDMII